MSYCIGMTGGIASGKSTVAMLFSQQGIEIISADKIARELTQKNKPAYEQIVAHYGRSLLTADKEINRRQLRELIVSQPEEREWLEQLLHPLIRQEIKQQVTLCTTAYCMIEIPLLINRHNYPYINRILLVTASEETQITRVMHRDQCSKEQAQAILSVQPDTALRLKNADDVVLNDAGIEELTATVHKLHQQYVRLSIECTTHPKKRI